MGRFPLRFSRHQVFFFFGKGEREENCIILKGKREKKAKKFVAKKQTE